MGRKRKDAAEESEGAEAEEGLEAAQSPADRPGEEEEAFFEFDYPAAKELVLKLHAKLSHSSIFEFSGQGVQQQVLPDLNKLLALFSE